MTTKRVVTLVLVANLLTIALVTAALQVTGVVQAGPLPFIGGNPVASYDPSLMPIVPVTMNYQGVLKDGEGNPISGEHELTFTIYRWLGIGGYEEVAWSETQAVSVANGLFNVALGSVNPLNGDIFGGILDDSDNGYLELGVKVDGGPELSPRTPLLTVPYAFRAEYVNRFPKPHYDSGWKNVSVGGIGNTFVHNLGGNPDNYIVDMQFKDTVAPNPYGVHQHFYGMNYDDVEGIRGAYWYWLDDSSINVYVGGHEEDINQVRIRIWRID